MGKQRDLRNLIERESLGFLMEAHNGLSARIAQEAGFEAIWASGLSMSAALGVRDNNEATWTQLLELLEFMSDHTQIPILVDGDTGYGDFNTMRRLVRKLESRDIGGVCVEDKVFPKTNSFINGKSQPLAPIDEFCGKIKAGKDAQGNDDFVIVARVEAFIAGWGLEEALRRAEAYHEAGADAILMHSALRNPDEVFSFANAWGGRAPVILVPTKYYTTPTDAFRQHDIAAVIWANHLLRASIAAMKKTADLIQSTQTLTSVEDAIASVPEVFRLQGADELVKAEERYLPKRAEKTKALVLAFSRGMEMQELTKEKPKSMVEIAGQPILHHIVDTLRSAGIKDIGVIRGYKKDAVTVDGASYFDTDTRNDRAEVLALSSAIDAIHGPCIISYGDVLFRKFIPSALTDTKDNFCVMIDTNWQESRNRDRYADYAICDRDPIQSGFYERVHLKQIDTDPKAAHIHGEWMGFLKMSARGSEICRELIELLVQDAQPGDCVDMAALINQIIAAGHAVRVLHTSGHWLDCDSALDAIDGSSFA